MWTCEVTIIKLSLAIIMVHGVVGIQLSNILQRIESETDSVVSDLTRMERNSKQTFENRINNLVIGQKQSVNNIVNTSIDRIRAKVTKAKQEGRTVDHCIEEARSALRPYVREAFTNLDDCRKSAITQLQLALNNIQSAINRGNEIKLSIIQIGLDCAGSSDMMTYNMCITQRAISVQINLRNLQAEYNTIQSTIASVSNVAENGAVECFLHVSAMIPEKTSQVEISANRCVNI